MTGCKSMSTGDLIAELESMGAKDLIKELESRGMSIEDILGAMSHDEKPNPTEQKDLESEVTQILHEIGIPARLLGYRYVRFAIILAIEEPETINAITKKMYPAIAKKFGTTSLRVERAIRHAIEVAWDRGNVDILNKYFGYTIDTYRGKPTNMEFIAMIADTLTIKMRGEGKE